MEESPIRILVADDHPVVRGGLVALLRTITGFEVVGEAADGEAAVREVLLSRPDIVLMDVRMPALDGVEATRRIRAAAPGTRVLMLTMYDDDATVFTAMQAGAQGYLLKEAEQDEIVRAVRGVVAGEAIFGPGVAERVLGYFSGPPAPISPEYPFPELTERERVVLELLARGRRTTEIASELFLSPKTVANNMTNIFAKLQVASRAEAIVRAHEGGLGGLGSDGVTHGPWLIAGLLPVLALLGGGAALLPTRAKVAGGCAIACALGVLLALAAWAGRHDPVAAAAFTASLMLPGALAALTYPVPRWRHAADYCALVLAVAAGLIATAFYEDGAVVSAMATATLLGLVAHEWWRYENADEDDRLAILWLSLAVVTATLIAGHALFLTTEIASGIIASVVFATLGPAMVIGVRRPRVVDVRGLIVQVLVLLVVVIVYIAVFVEFVALLDLLGQHAPSTGVLALVGALAATTFHPLRVVLRGAVDEILFGDRPDPLDAAARVVRRVGDDPVLALRAIREALVLPYASLSSGGVELASSGTAVTHVRRLSLQLGEDDVGEIVVGLRPGDLTLSAGDERVLRIVAPLLAQTLRARNLAADLQTSRGQAIAAIEEERRRLRRDLHDGLGPTLSGIAFTADAARNTLRAQPESADELLRSLRAEAVTAVGEIRRLVYDMRPPALDELGLVPALRQRAGTIRTPDGRTMRVSVDAPDALPDLPAAVETAAYRIATEALTNAARHSGSDEAGLRIAVQTGALSVAVSDAGRNEHGWTPGVGLSSMRERAAEVGGTLSVSDADGFVVQALLPIA